MPSENAEQPRRPGDKMPGVTLSGPKDAPFKDHPNTEHRDWRLRAITTTVKPFKSTTTGKTFPEGTVIVSYDPVSLDDNLIMIPGAHPSALYLSLAARLRDLADRFISEKLRPCISDQSPDETYRVPDALEAELFECMEDLFGSVVFSFTAIEAFANSAIPEDYIYRNERQDGRNTEIYNKGQIEKSVTLDVKLDEILPDILNIDSPKGKKQWTEYVWLRNTRNRLIHLKTNDLKVSGSDPSSVWSVLFDQVVLKAPSIAKNLILEYDPNKSQRWLVNCPF